MGRSVQEEDALVYMCMLETLVFDELVLCRTDRNDPITIIRLKQT
jgi:hypothetical protein